MYDQDQGLTRRYHNTTLDTKEGHTSFILQARGLEGSNTKARYTSESTEATISEYKHKLNKFCLKKASTNEATIEEARPPARDLLTTPGLRRPPCSSIRRRWHLAPGINHLVASIGNKKEGGKGVAKQP